MPFDTICISRIFFKITITVSKIEYDLKYNTVCSVSKGVITGIKIVNPGSGYTSAPTVRIASPPFTPKLSIDVAKIRVRLEVVLGRKYQIESSSDLQAWTKTGDAFVAQDEVLQQDFDVDAFGRYFRINQVP